MGSKRIVRIPKRRRIPLPRRLDVGSWFAVAVGLASLSLITFYGQNCGNGGMATTGNLTLTPASGTVLAGTAVPFQAAGGTPPYTYSLVTTGTGIGTISSSTGLYVAPATAVTVQVKVTDAVGNAVESTVNVSTSSDGTAFTLSPLSQTVAPSGTVQFIATGGKEPYRFTIFSGGGQIDQSSKIYTAPASGTAVVIGVQDAAGTYQFSNLVVSGPSTLNLSAPASTVTMGGTLQFTTVNGTSPYTYTISPQLGTIDSNGLYRAPTSGLTSSNSVNVHVVDRAGSSADLSITVSGNPVNPCAGTYRIYQYTSGAACDPNGAVSPPYSGTMTLTADSNGVLSGRLYFSNGNPATTTISNATCTSGRVSMTRTWSSYVQILTGSYYSGYSGPQNILMQGTYSGSYAPGGWSWCAAKQ